MAEKFNVKISLKQMHVQFVGGAELDWLSSEHSPVSIYTQKKYRQAHNDEFSTRLVPWTIHEHP